MTPYEMEEQLKYLDARSKAIEQILPTLATKEDLKAFATKEDLKVFATKDDLKAYATKADLKTYATKEDLRLTRDELKGDIGDVKRHNGMLIDAVRDDMRLLAGQMATRGDINELRREMRSLGDDVRLVAEQVALLSAEKRKKR